MLVPKSWYPADLLQGKSSKDYGIIVLNQPINKNALHAIIQDATFLICADAGGNRLMEYDQSGKYRTRKPDAIVGDLDSLDATAKNHYVKTGVQIVHDPDQYSTDFTKCLKWMRQQWDEKHGPQAELDIVVMGGLGGRVDQGFSQVHHLYMALTSPELLNGAIYLLSEQSMSYVLEANENIMHVSRDVFAENIGIIPVLGLTHITTSGLEWDVFNWPTEFGGQVSTSNHLRSDVVKISVLGPRPLFTLELVPVLCAEGTD